MSNRDLLALLTRAEIDTLYAYCEYETVKETAAFLHRSQQTVKNHLSNAYHKLGVTKGHSAVYRLGLHEWLDVPDIKIDIDEDERAALAIYTSIDPPTKTFAKG